MKLLKYKIAFLFLIAGFAAAKAQDAEWSNAEKFRNRTAYNKILGQNADGIYVLRSKSRYFSRKNYIQLYRENMGLVFNKPMPGLKKAVFESAFVFPDRLDVFKSRYNKKTREIDLLYQKYSMQAEPEGDEKFLTSSPLKDYADDGDYILRQSTDRTKILAYHTEIDENKSAIIEILVLEAGEMREIVKKKMVLPYRFGNFTTMDLAVENNGNAYFIFRVEDDERKKDAYERFGYYLFAYDAVTGDVKNYYLNNEDTYLSRVALSVDYLNSRVIACGFYSLEEAGRSKGIMDFGMDTKTHAQLYHSFMPYPEAFVSNVIGPSAAARGDELRDFFIRRIVPRSDGGYMLVAEEYYTSTQTYTFSVNGMMQMGSREIYNFGKVVTISVNSNGTIDWGKVINKLQTSSLDFGYYSSIYVVSLKDQVKIFYNDENKGSSEITEYSLNNRGEMDSKLLFKSQSSNIAIVPREAQQLDATTILFPAAKDRKFAFLKLFVN